MKEEMINKIREKRAKITVVGLGRVGLPVATIFANAGYHVTGVDNNKIVNTVSSPEFSSKEKGLQELIRELVKIGKLDATNDIAKAIKSTNIVIICV